MKKKNSFYVVWVGKTPGIYSSWEECKIQVEGFPNAVYKGFSSLKLAEEAFENDSKNYIGKKIKEEIDYKLVNNSLEGLIKDSICVDGAWNTATNHIEYQGVLTETRTLLFRVGPFSFGTNNIAEFLGIVHALGYCKQKELILPIYSDSKTAISWIKKKKANTKIPINDSSKEILSLIRRAEKWLNTNTYLNEILKWETSKWGENPADFGRK